MKFLKIRDVKSPERGTEKSAGIDFFVPNDFSEMVLMPKHDVLIPSGIKVGLPENTMLMAADKSGLASSATSKVFAGMKVKPDAHDSSLIVGAKIVDEDYPGEVHLHIINVGKCPVNIKPGMKIVQFIVVPIIYTEPSEVTSEEELGYAKTSRSGGFSSTGLK